jgi:L-malate glycosyltransferase
LKIIHVSTPVSWRGGEQQLAYLVKALNDGHTNIIMCPEGSVMQDYCQKNELLFESFATRGFLNISAARFLKTLCQKHNADIIHCHDSHAHSIAVTAATLFLVKVPVVVHRRVDFPVSPGFISRYKYNHPQIKAYICVSQAILELLVPSLRHPEKAVVIHSSIDMARFTQDKSDRKLLRSELGLDDNHLLIGNTSALAPHKDHPSFIRMADILHRRFPQMRFVIIGDGPSRSEVEKLIETHKLMDIVILAGFRNNIAQLLPGLDVFVMSSRTEGLGTSILDAFASDVPVVVTAAGGIPELVDNEVTGILCEIGNSEQLAEAVVRIIEDASLRESLVTEAAKKAAQFDFRSMANKTRIVYEKILSEVDHSKPKTK